VLLDVMVWKKKEMVGASDGGLKFLSDLTFVLIDGAVALQKILGSHDARIGNKQRSSSEKAVMTERHKVLIL
jgi:hypothetical protein